MGRYGSIRIASVLLIATGLAFGQGGTVPLPGGSDGALPTGPAGAVQSSNGSGAFADSGCTATSGALSCTKISLSSSASGLSSKVTNDTGTGTTAKYLSKLDSSGHAVIAATTDTAIPVFVTLVTDANVGCTAGTSGLACLLKAGQGTCTADASGVTAQHYIVASTATAGRCADGGATIPANRWVIGQAQATAAANADAVVELAQGYLSQAVQVHSFGASFDGGGSALTSGKTVYFTVPYACTVQGWNVAVDTGTATIDIWKIATGTAIPTISNTITASALPAIATGTAIHSTTLTAWTTTVAANDIVGVNLKTVATATQANLTVQCQ